MSEIEALRRELDYLKNRPIGMGSTFTEIGNKMLAIADLNIKIAELLLKQAESK